MSVIPFPVFMSLLPLGTLPPSGSASFALLTPTIEGALDAQRVFLQGFVRSASGALFLGSPLHRVVLNCSVLGPDCNANAECDTCDVLRATSSDCNSNGIPDECEIDCNLNGIPDGCDIAAGTSQDLNHNGIPDECDPQLSTYYVDVSAPVGGNGSSGAPFQTLAQAFAVAISRDTILVANGSYTGAQNRKLAFGGRELVVQSLGGAANCTIDCQMQGRAFSIDGGVAANNRIEGFTIKNGMLTSAPDNFGAGLFLRHSNATVVDCRFENNTAPEGGAVYVNAGGLILRGCEFRNNRAPFGRGGALSAILNTGLGIVDCSFVSNTAGEGGAIDISGASLPAATARIERCVFLNNFGTNRGGALKCSTLSLELDQCLIAGNHSQSAAAILGFSCNLRILQSTIVDNPAANQGGALLLGLINGDTSTCDVRNSVVWGNTPSAEQFRVLSGTLDIDSCSIQNGAAAVTANALAILVYGAHNQTLPPQFVDPDGADNDPATVGDNDYRLALNSPCIDAGNNAELALDWFDLDGDGILTEPVPLDFDGLTRQVDIPSTPDTGLGVAPLVDLGAWERQP
jgi:predicted outer membrane repeat protein